MHAQAAVVPGVEVKQDFFIAPELRCAENHTALQADLAAGFFEDDAPRRDAAFDDFVDAQRDVSINTTLLIEVTGDSEHAAPNDGARADD